MLAITRGTTVAAMIAAMICTSGFVSAENTTLENMQAAFYGESNAHARYLAFAKQADEEGYKQVAALFRAAASAEQIHANLPSEPLPSVASDFDDD